ncbi:PPC domain-containing DNA-binding protein [Parapusillimonas granuli]|uniref:DNA-binding protein n=1 Tax=Parapusillimonas granuli TaxID=380911 RepID=A0A853FWF6_9BURK|nr:PPC domain-containing DNA-binding protein [Parapusillimonas granuli]MBB5214659.1 putative DNA-binding protein with PD1-like motif [Parapusillimonas granuli]NYT48933.1 DNA-binding protein [Parapusillimonas granuli]
MDAKLVRGSFGRVFNARLCTNDDLVESVEQLCLKHNVREAVVRGGLGSLFRSEIRVGNERRHVEGYAVELLTLDGNVAVDPRTGRLDVSLHGVIADNKGVVHAGTFLKGGSPTCVTVELVVQEWLPAGPKDCQR